VIKVAKGKTGFLRFYISGSDQKREEVVRNIALVKSGLPRLFAAKKQRYLRLEKNAAIEIPDKKIMEAYLWGKYSSDWLGGCTIHGKSHSAGLPDYPWFFSTMCPVLDALYGKIEPDILQLLEMLRQP
jgi:hypothetical protein